MLIIIAPYEYLLEKNKTQAEEEKPVFKPHVIIKTILKIKFYL